MREALIMLLAQWDILRDREAAAANIRRGRGDATMAIDSRFLMHGLEIRNTDRPHQPAVYRGRSPHPSTLAGNSALQGAELAGGQLERT